MQWLAIGAIGLVLAAAALWAGTNIIGGATLSSPSESPSTQVEGVVVDTSLLRDEQRLSNALFEVVPGEVIVRRPGEYSMRVRVRNFDPTLTLQPHFWALEATAYTDAGEVLPAQGTFLSWSGKIVPEGELTGTWFIETDPEAKAYHVTLKYDEPGRTATSADFLWPYGR